MSTEHTARLRVQLHDIARLYAQLADRDHAAVTGSGGPNVSVSKTPPIPISVDEVDLTSPARLHPLEQTAAQWQQDQIGHLAVATELDFCVRDVADLYGDPLPVPTVPALALWLASPDRLAWMWDHYGAVDELIAVVDRIVCTLNGVLTERRPKAEQKAAPCPACGEQSLVAAEERVTCSTQDCGRALTETEYAEWSRLVLIRDALGGDGISGAEIALRWNRPKGTVKWLAHKHGWSRTADKQRPVLYLKAQVEETMREIEAAKREKVAA